MGLMIKSVIIKPGITEYLFNMNFSKADAREPSDISRCWIYNIENTLYNCQNSCYHLFSPHL